MGQSKVRWGAKPLPFGNAELLRVAQPLLPIQRGTLAKRKPQPCLPSPSSFPCRAPDPTDFSAGWIFGERLHDQERGWFPSSMTEEILNPKIRSQNLKECFRVHKMEDPQRSQNKDRRKLGSRNRQ